MADCIVRESGGRPVRLAGLGRSGWVALRCALELQGRDVGVALVGMIDVSQALLAELPWTGNGLHVAVVQTQALAGESVLHTASAWKKAAPDHRLTFESSTDLSGAIDCLVRLEDADATQRRSVPAFNPVHVIRQARDASATVVCIPGAGDSITRYLGFAAELGPAVTLVGLQPRGVDGADAPHTNVEAAALANVRALDAGHLQGPVHLIGHSFGGWIAFEMASLMEAAGKPVASLTLVDSEAPDANGLVDTECTPGEALKHFVELIQLSAPRALELRLDDLAAASPQDQLAMLHQAMMGAGIFSPRTKPSVLAGPFRTFCAALRTAYSPGRSLDAPVSLVLVDDSRLGAEQNAQVKRHRQRGWGQFAPRLRLADGPGNHMTVLAMPCVRQLFAWWERTVFAPSTRTLQQVHRCP